MICVECECDGATVCNDCCVNLAERHWQQMRAGIEADYRASLGMWRGLAIALAVSLILAAIVWMPGSTP